MPASIQVFVKGRFRHGDTAHHGEVLDIGAPFHELLEAAVQVADVSLALHDFITTQGQFQRHVAGDAGVLRTLPELDVFTRGKIDRFRLGHVQ